MFQFSLTVKFIIFLLHRQGKKLLCYVTDLILPPSPPVLKILDLIETKIYDFPHDKNEGIQETKLFYISTTGEGGGGGGGGHCGQAL